MKTKKIFFEADKLTSVDNLNSNKNNDVFDVYSCIWCQIIITLVWQPRGFLVKPPMMWCKVCLCVNTTTNSTNTTFNSNQPKIEIRNIEKNVQSCQSKSRDKTREYFKISVLSLTFSGDLQHYNAILYDTS